MKKFMTICCLATIVAAAASCDKTENTGYTGTNYIYLTSDSNSMYDTADDALDVKVLLTTALKEDLILTFAVSGDESGVITLEVNPLTIKAGSKEGILTVKAGAIEEFSQNFKLTLDKATKLPENVAWKEDFSFTVNSSAVSELTEEQQAIVKAYEEKTGINLLHYIGVVDVETVYTASNPDSEIPNEPVTIKGKTTIELSEASTLDAPVLKMTVNPMGLTDVLYAKLKDLTVNNTDWYDEYALPSYQQLMEAINWSPESDETFAVTLDGITLNEDASVDFVEDVTFIDPVYDEELTHTKVNFQFAFSAYDREKLALTDGKIGTAIDEDWASDATANPIVWLNSDDTSEDLYECGNYVESSASISKDALTFTFCLYNTNDYDYSKVIATYSPRK